MPTGRLKIARTLNYIQNPHLRLTPSPLILLLVLACVDYNADVAPTMNSAAVWSSSFFGSERLTILGHLSGSVILA